MKKTIKKKKKLVKSKKFLPQETRTAKKKIDLKEKLTIINTVILIFIIFVLGYLVLSKSKVKKNQLEVSQGINKSAQGPGTGLNPAEPSLPLPAVQTADIQPVGDWQNYINKDNAFTIQYPGNWLVDEYTDNMQFYPKNSASIFPFIEIRISKGTLDAQKALTLKSLGSQAKEEKIKVGTISAIQISGTVNDEIYGSRQETHLFFEKNSQLYEITSFGNNMEKIFKQFISSFKFTK